MSSRGGPRRGGGPSRGRGRGSNPNHDANDTSVFPGVRTPNRGRSGSAQATFSARNNHEKGGRGAPGRGRGGFGEGRGRGASSARGSVSHGRSFGDAGEGYAAKSTLKTSALQQVTTEGDANTRFESVCIRRTANIAATLTRRAFS
jgi:hypothetical protein